MAIVPEGNNSNNYKISVHLSRRLLHGVTQAVKTNDDVGYFFTIPIKRQLQGDDAFIAELKSCENCVICFSKGIVYPNFNVTETKHPDCDLIVGKRAADDE